MKLDKVEPAYVSIPAQLISLHRYLMLAADGMFVLGLPFLPQNLKDTIHDRTVHASWNCARTC